MFDLLWKLSGRERNWIELYDNMARAVLRRDDEISALRHANEQLQLLGREDTREITRLVNASSEATKAAQSD